MKHQRITLKDLRDGEQPRKLIAEAVSKLAQSIKDLGLIQPITVRTIPICGNTVKAGYQIVAGHHRVAACRELGMSEIDAIVLDVDTSLQQQYSWDPEKVIQVA